MTTENDRKTNKEIEVLYPFSPLPADQEKIKLIEKKGEVVIDVDAKFIPDGHTRISFDEWTDEVIDAEIANGIFLTVNQEIVWRNRITVVIQ